MGDIELSVADEIAVLKLTRGKVNALSEGLVEDLMRSLQGIETAEGIRSVMITGQGNFFSFGFDIPEFLRYPKEAFIGYLKKFTALYDLIFLFPKPVIAALNGHTIAGGCMIAAACDYRVMAAEKAKISLNEITFGAAVFAGAAEILRHCCGARNAERILTGGSMLTAGEAYVLGLVDEAVPGDRVASRAREVAASWGAKDQPAFEAIKNLMRKPVAQGYRAREMVSIYEFADIWYSEKTWAKIKSIGIR